MAGPENKQNEAAVKIAVVGQPGAGKKEIVKQLASVHGQASVRTSCLSGTEVARTEFIWPDPLPDGGPFVRVRVFALTGTPLHQAAEQCVLRQADAVVFVVNCDPGTIEASRARLLEMLGNAGLAGIDWGKATVVMHYNRADRYPQFKPSDLDGWLGIKDSGVSRHVTAGGGDDLGAAVMDAAAKAVAKLARQPAEVSPR